MLKINENQKGFIRCQKLSSTSSTKVFPLFVKIAVKAGNLIKVCQLYFYLAKINHGKMSVKEVLKGTMLWSTIAKLPKWCQVLHSCTQ